MQTEIIFYGSDSCRFCKDAKKWLEKEGVNYSMRDVQIQENRKEFLSYEVPGIPLLIVKDFEGNIREKIAGFLPDKYEKALK